MRATLVYADSSLREIEVKGDPPPDVIEVPERIAPDRSFGWVHTLGDELIEPTVRIRRFEKTSIINRLVYVETP